MLPSSVYSRTEMYKIGQQNCQVCRRAGRRRVAYCKKTFHWSVRHLPLGIRRHCHILPRDSRLHRYHSGSLCTRSTATHGHAANMTCTIVLYSRPITLLLQIIHRSKVFLSGIKTRDEVAMGNGSSHLPTHNKSKLS